LKPLRAFKVALAVSVSPPGEGTYDI
jgi:hypothetical protein